MARAQQDERFERGAKKAASCETCHGPDGAGPLPGVPALAGQQREFLVLQMFYLREGLRDVPQMAGMLKGYADRDLEDVAYYYNRRSHVQVTAPIESTLFERGAGLSKAMGCGSCHHADYRGQKHVPKISAQREDYLLVTLKAYRDNKRTGTDTSMNAAMYQVSDADIEALAHYLAHQPRLASTSVR
jgi:cytochrome c553